MINIYTDGSCLKNPGNGGWAFAMLKNNKISKIGSGSNLNTTNNRMELFAIIKAIENTKSDTINIYSDSKWAINCAKGVWKRKANLDLWDNYTKVLRSRNITFFWVKGHSDNIYNDLVDKLAFKEAKNII